MADGIDHDARSIVVGVERVEHVARFDLEPAHVAAPATEWHEADARAWASFQAYGKLVPIAAPMSNVTGKS